MVHCSGEDRQKQKAQYNKSAQEPKVRVGDRVMVHMPGELKGKDHKLARPYHGPYCVLKVTSNNAEVVLVDQPKVSSIFVALNRVRLCYPEQTDETWTGARKRRKRRGKKRLPSRRSGPPFLVLAL